MTAADPTRPRTCPRCGTPWPPGRAAGLCPRCLLQEDDAPVLLGDSLELLDEIGRGGMGIVYRARDRRLGRMVAVKFLDPALAAEPGFVRRLDREAQVLARLAHPGIVAIHGLGEDEGRQYIVMEYVAGRTLAERAPLPIAEACRVVADAADAVAHAHAQGIVHRDLKPANVLVDDHGAVKVTDFGIARLVEGGSGAPLTAAGEVLGTPRYMAPEALTGAPPDARMDVFALGVLLYEAITGAPPQGDFVPLPGHLDTVVRKALCPDPRRRQGSARELARDIRAAAPGSDGDSLPPDERNWLRAVALLQTLATAAVLWALLVSITPRVIGAAEVSPLTMLRAEPLPDGRVVSRARFEIGPTLAAVAAMVVALIGYGLLRAHWRLAGLDRRQPETPLAESRSVLAWGGLALSLYLVRQALEAAGHGGLTPYVPILGGVMEIGVVFNCWVAVLSAWRTGRPLTREPMLWAGLALALVPPVTDLLGFLHRWHP